MRQQPIKSDRKRKHIDTISLRGLILLNKEIINHSYQWLADDNILKLLQFYSRYPIKSTT